MDWGWAMVLASAETHEAALKAAHDALALIEVETTALAEQKTA